MGYAGQGVAGVHRGHATCQAEWRVGPGESDDDFEVCGKPTYRSVSNELLDDPNPRGRTGLCRSHHRQLIEECVTEFRPIRRYKKAS